LLQNRCHIQPGRRKLRGGTTRPEEAAVEIFRRFRAAFAFAALVAVTACTTWQPYQDPAGPVQLPSQVRVTLDSGEQLTLRDPYVLGDSLLVGREDREGPLQTVPLATVQMMEARTFNAGKAMGLLVITVGVVVGAFWGILYLVQCTGGGSDC
jgi:hypothetical protein